jgi:hypothetical protein
MTDWSRFDAALERGSPQFWWRDDDAVAESPALHRLMDLAESVNAPLTLAVIPGNLEGSLPTAIKDRDVTVAVHGWTHTNHAPDSEKKAEFRAHRPVAEMLKEAAKGKSILDAEFGAQALPLFIPPWNRVAPDLPLATSGYQGVSVFGQREISRDGNLTRLDAHIDPIEWRGSRSAVPAQQIVDQITDLLVVDEPIGLMTHHLVHDDAIWALTEALVQRISSAKGAWVCARALLTRQEGPNSV